MQRCLAFFLGLFLAGAAQANELDALLPMVWKQSSGSFAGASYGPPEDASRRTQRWLCDSCEPASRITFGIYDYAYNYATRDTEKVLRMISGACGYDSCQERYMTLDGFKALEQSGMDRRGPSRRLSVIIGDRLIIWEVEGAASAARAKAVHDDLMAKTWPLIKGAL